MQKIEERTAETLTDPACDIEHSNAEGISRQEHSQQDQFCLGVVNVADNASCDSSDRDAGSGNDRDACDEIDSGSDHDAGPSNRSSNHGDDSGNSAVSDDSGNSTVSDDSGDSTGSGFHSDLEYL